LEWADLFSEFARQIASDFQENPAAQITPGG